MSNHRGFTSPPPAGRYQSHVREFTSSGLLDVAVERPLLSSTTLPRQAARESARRSPAFLGGDDGGCGVPPAHLKVPFDFSRHGQLERWHATEEAAARAGESFAYRTAAPPPYTFVLATSSPACQFFRPRATGRGFGGGDGAASASGALKEPKAARLQWLEVINVFFRGRPRGGHSTGGTPASRAAFRRLIASRVSSFYSALRRLQIPHRIAGFG